MVYLQQSFKDIPVFNQMQVLAFKGDKLVSATGGRIPGLDKLVNLQNALPITSAKDAVQAVLTDRKLFTDQPIVVIKDSAGKTIFGTLNVSAEKIQVSLVWLPLNKEVRLTWEVFIAPKNTSDMWLIRVDAVNNQVLDKNNLTVNDGWGYQTPVEDIYRKNFVMERKAFQPDYRPFTVNSATYRVVPYPAESPNHPGGTPSLVTDPWTMASGTATTLKWHSDGTAEHDSTRGNNVWAQEDRDGNNSTFGRAAASTTPQPDLSFDFPPDFTLEPVNPATNNQKFALTNLFYWNNLMHDISYLYGFDEVSGNFQANNLGRGGVGNDYVIADGQDASGVNNANFSTPVDGIRPRMQMYLFISPTPDRDGDLDNGVISHEYTHGISTRLTGGPGNSSCLGNAEQGGEGWSDYFALMVTTNWSTATINDGSLARPMGTYVLNQSPTGPGIRQHPYSTDMAVDPWTYAMMAGTGGEVHDIGEIWCTALWEMTWELIRQTNTINTNLFNPSGTGGNSVALKIVMEGMRLQPCSPGYIDARNAILKADTLFFGAQYSCSIWKAFAKRGMGRFASQGSSSSTTDQVADFSADNTSFLTNINAPQVSETQNIIYTTHLTAGICTPLSNYFITDSLPNSVTWVSGGSYNSANRTVTFNPVTLSTGQSQDYNFTINVNAGTYFVPVDHINETLTGATIPATWTASSTTASVWTVSAAQSHSSPNSFFAPEPTTISDEILATSSGYTLNSTVAAFSTLSFWHRFNTEAGYDGAVIEISPNNGASWSDLGSKIIKNGYNGSIPTTDGSPIGGRSAWTGNSGTFIQTIVDLRSYAGQTVKIRFRMASDNGTSGQGWYVDDIILRSEPAVFMRSSLFNSSGVRQSISDTITQIINSCSAAIISTQSSNTSACLGNNASFSVSVSGSGVIYQWQSDQGSGFNNLANTAPYSGVNTATLTITGITAAMNGYQYRCIINGTCTSVFNSNAATLTINTAPSITSNPNNATACTGNNTSFTVAANGSSPAYQWQVDQGSGFTNLTNSAPYSGVTTAILAITGITAGMNNYQYRCIVTTTGCTSSATSTAAQLIITTAPSITGQPTGASVCPGISYTFNITSSGSGISYQWQLSTNGGGLFTNIPGANAASYILSGITTVMNGDQYRCVVTGACAPNAISNAAVLTVYTPVSLSSQPVNATVCAGSNTNLSVAGAGSGISYQWQVSTNGGTTFTNINGATVATLPLNAVTISQNAWQYRSVVSGNCGTITSTAATLNVNPLPVFTLLNIPSVVCLSDTAFILNASLAGGIWSGSGVQGSKFNPAVAGVGSFPVTYTVTNSFGCTSFQSTNIQVNECPERHRKLDTKNAVMIYPNPNSGKLFIKMNSDLYNKIGLKVYSTEGRFIKDQVFTGLFFGTIMQVDLSRVQDGVYMLYLYNENGGQTVHKTFRIVIGH